MSTIWAPMRPGRVAAASYEGRIGERQLAFIANVLKEFPADKLVVTGMHIPLQNYLDPDRPVDQHRRSRRRS